ncbi:MAG: hypothetical protein HDR28_07600 [Lachnospiraceae bacterium]|nr:hypothetical protein [Lachnospiraceae bacterium]MBD5516792.1 hypothetical protein [Lachnospiraceae bacterium]
MAKMTNDILSPEAMVMVSGSSIGTQKNIMTEVTLHIQLRKYESILKDDSLIVG